MDIHPFTGAASTVGKKSVALRAVALESLLLVVFDDPWIAHLRIFGAESRVAARASLAQQVPALIQADLELLHARVLFGIQPDAFRVLHEFVFFLYQILDVLKEFGIGHDRLLIFFPLGREVTTISPVILSPTFHFRNPFSIPP